MRIKVLTSISGADFSYMGNETVDVSEECGKELVRAGYAEPVEDQEDRVALEQELTSLGVVVRANWKIETLKLKLQEAKAKAATNAGKPAAPWIK